MRKLIILLLLLPTLVLGQAHHGYQYFAVRGDTSTLDSNRGGEFVRGRVYLQNLANSNQAKFITVGSDGRLSLATPAGAAMDSTVMQSKYQTDTMRGNIYAAIAGSGGTPTLTAGYIGYGSTQNTLTGSDSLIFIPSVFAIQTPNIFRTYAYGLDEYTLEIDPTAADPHSKLGFGGNYINLAHSKVTIGSSNGDIDLQPDGYATIYGSQILYSGGALGTPSSGDLSNCTGFPSYTAGWGLLGTFYVDTAYVASRARLQKVGDSVAALIPSVSGYKLISDSATTTGYATRGWRQKAVDSLNINDALRVKYTDTASMLAPYLRTVNATSGTVTSVATGNGLSGGTITSTGTLTLDTSIASTKNYRQKAVDSLNINTALRVKYTDTASMLAPYLRTVNATSGTVTSVATSTGTGITGGTITTSGTIAADTTILGTRAWRDKLKDSLNTTIALRVKYTDTASMLAPYLRTVNATSGTVTSVATGYGLSGGTITSTGTLIADTATTFSKYTTTLGSGTGISITGRTITNSAPDQTVALTGGYGITPSGTYPNFTITEDTATTFAKVLSTLGAGTNITITGRTINSSNTGGTVTNVIGGTNISITGTSTIQPTVNITGTIAVANGGTGTTATTSVNTTPITLGSNNTVAAAAGTLTGSTLASGVTASSLTSVGTIATGVWNGTRLTSSYVPTDVAYYDVVQSWSKGQAGTISTLTDASTIAVDLSLGNNLGNVVMAGNRTLGVPTNIVAGQSGTMTFYQDVTGSRTLTPSWIYGGSGGTAITLSTGKLAHDIVSYYVDYYLSATATMTIATPCVVTQTGHGMPVGGCVKVQFTTTGALPTGVSASTTYYATIVDANTYKLSTSFANAQAGTFVATSGSQSGTHTGVIGNITLAILTDSR